LNIMTFFAVGMLVVSQKPAGKSPDAIGAGDGDGAVVAGAVGCVDGTTIDDAIWPAEFEPQPARAIPAASNEPIESLVIESIRAVS
jgi:hypothetical protein